MEVEDDYQFKTLNINEDDDYSRIKQCVKNIIKNEGYTKFSVEKRVFGGDGSNFLGILYDVHIKGETDKGKKENSLFLKVITPGEQMTIISLSDAYLRELFVYRDLSKMFEQLQDEVNLPRNERYKMVQSYDESTPNVIILNNMKQKGYTTSFRMDTMSLQFAELAIKELAKFHALSFVLEKKKPQYYEKKIRTRQQPFSFNEEMNALLHNVCQLTLSYLDEKSQKKFKDFIPLYVKKLTKHMETKSGRDVLCHGDYRANNILMKELNGEIIDLIPVDFQLIYHGCPINDILYLIFTGTDRAFRKSHLSHLKTIYYEQLREFLSHFDLDVTKVYPKEEFEAHFKESLEYGLILSVLFVPFILAVEEDLPDVTGEVAGIKFKVDSRFKDRMAGIVEDFIEWGCL